MTLKGNSMEFIQAKVEEWLAWDKNEKTSSEIQKLAEAKDYETLGKLMHPRLLFGTAGIRGKMGPGYACMNDLIIVQTSQGLAKYLLSVCPEVKTKGVVIGHDKRHNSDRFILLAASSFLHCDIPVYLLSKICPTPFVPFSVVHLKAAAGVMVTASHNPKDDNGYKVFWDNGAQILPPHDSGIQNAALENLKPLDEVWDVDELYSHPKLKDPFDQIYEAYFSVLASAVYNSELNASYPDQLTATAMHGVAHEYLTKAFEVCKFKPYIPVKEQMIPDPDFPTVKFPNPEEGKSSLDLSFKTADENGSEVILANDPDADRLAVAIKLPTKEWKVLSGNEIGGLLGWWAWHRFRSSSPDVNPNDVYMIASTVSSKILGSIAKKEGFNFIETLTGFKWMGNKADQLKRENKFVLFAYEEAIGFMDGSEVLDKDGITAAIRMAEMIAYLHSIGMTLNDKLMDLYRTYGYHANIAGYYLCYDPNVIKKIFNRIRNFDGPNTYPKSVGDGRYIVSDVRDLTTGFDSSQPDQKAVLPLSSSSQMITFKFTNSCVITFRTSGTEPKLKYYSEICASPSDDQWDSLKEELNQLISTAIETLLEPQKNGLIPKPV